MQAALRFFLIFVLLSSNLWATGSSSYWYFQEADKKVAVNVDLFLSSTCSHCQKEDEFFREIEPQFQWLHVTRYFINKNKNALVRFNQLLNDQQMDDFAVPSAFLCNSRWVGFASDKTTGKDLLHALNYCKQQIEQHGALTDSTVSVLKRWANANLFDSGTIEKTSAAQYITGVALLDAFNPCALFCIASYFVFLFLQERRGRQILAGFVFILTIGSVHYFQQAYASIFFEWLSWLRFPALLAGLFGFYLVNQYVRNRTTQHLLIPATFLFGFLIQAYQQTCLMNWSYIFQQWLANQQYSREYSGLIQLAYQLTYVSPLLIILFVCMLLIKSKRFVKYKQRLEPSLFMLLLVISLLLVFYPLVLSSLALSVAILLLLAVGTWFLQRKKVKNG